VTESKPVIADPSALPTATKTATDHPARSPLALALPEIPRSFPELDSLTDVQLERLLHDDVALEAHVETHVASVQTMRSMIEELRTSNAEAASNNLLMVSAAGILFSVMCLPAWSLIWD
jgi:hypothetical protein